MVPWSYLEPLGPAASRGLPGARRGLGGLGGSARGGAQRRGAADAGPQCGRFYKSGIPSKGVWGLP